MMFLSEIFSRISYWKNADRIGPDILYTHWRLHFKTTMLKLCKQKFKYFADSAELRPGAYAICCSKISIGSRVVIRPNTMLFADDSVNGAGITICDYVLMGSGFHLYTDGHKFDNPIVPIINQGYGESGEIILEKGCWIGANVTILPGIIIGRNSVIGAGSVVTKSIPERVVAVGNPAKIIKRL
jgi:acetyltransferase-like isoleucine patch superfamily enzyme